MLAISQHKYHGKIQRSISCYKWFVYTVYNVLVVPEFSICLDDTYALKVPFSLIEHVSYSFHTENCLFCGVQTHILCMKTVIIQYIS